MFDGVVALRAATPADAPTLIAGRDDTSRRYLGPGSEDPRPTAIITVHWHTVGWVDYDVERSWLRPGEVNVGYNVFPEHRGRGYASRSVQLLMHHLAVRTDVTSATLLIDADNERSLALARRLRFHQQKHAPEDQCFFKRLVPPLLYTDGVVTLRRPAITDLDADLAAKDDEQIRWLWLPGHREAWAAMSPPEQREHARHGLQQRVDCFGTGPKWTFSVDTRDASYVAYVDCDLANDQVPAGDANVAYSSHPAHRGRGYMSRAVRLVAEFLGQHTGARELHIIVDAQNAPSLRVARTVGAKPTGQSYNDRGRLMIRHVLALTAELQATQDDEDDEDDEGLEDPDTRA